MSRCWPTRLMLWLLADGSPVSISAPMARRKSSTTFRFSRLSRSKMRGMTADRPKAFAYRASNAS